MNKPTTTTDRKTGQTYSPAQAFDKMMNKSEIMAQFARMKNEVGNGWPVRSK